VELPRPDGGDPVVVPGNPIKLSGLSEQAQTPPPMLGQHTDEVLSAELGLDADALAELRAAGVIR
jgi:crotonobetainyl-CoA:carnitine CoA-transferase CaiB-like acyl-CoA transferase